MRAFAFPEVTRSDLHPFLRYAGREKVVTNNTLLLVQRGYAHSQVKFREPMLPTRDLGSAAARIGVVAADSRQAERARWGDGVGSLQVALK